LRKRQFKNRYTLVPEILLIGWRRKAGLMTPLCNHYLSSKDYCLRCRWPVTQSRVGPFRVVFHAPPLPQNLCLLQRVKDLAVQNSSRSFPLKLSQYPFSHGLPGSMSARKEVLFLNSACEKAVGKSLAARYHHALELFVPKLIHESRTCSIVHMLPPDFSKKETLPEEY